MSLTVINNDNYMQAIDLLNRLADPVPEISYWHKTLNNLMTYANKKDTAPGYLLEIKGKFIFVLLTIEYSREHNGKQLNFVNISSLYIEKEYQYLAGVAVNEIIKNSKPDIEMGAINVEDSIKKNKYSDHNDDGEDMDNKEDSREVRLKIDFLDKITD